jgi:hypothetical protein
MGRLERKLKLKENSVILGNSKKINLTSLSVQGTG